MGDEELDLDEIESAFTFLGDTAATGDYLDVSSKPKTFDQFARKYFQDKSVAGYKYVRGPITGPLVKQIWGDDDAERMLAVWYAILRFMGDLPSDEDDDAPLDNLQKVQFICDIGLKRRNTRDEIYCQVCRQLTANPSKPSSARGWILLSLLCGTFTPSDAFIDVLKNFIASGPPNYVPFLNSQLTRTIKNGIRAHPPTACELMMAFKRSPITFPVHFFIASHEVKVDSQTTNQELIYQCYENEKLSPELGLSIFISSPTMDMMTPVSAGYSHLMDTIYEYENISAKRPDWRILAQQKPWVAMLRKEVFAPWFESTDNIDIIYSQIMDGLIRGIYVCNNDRDLALLLAQRYLVKHGNKLDADKLTNDLRSQPVSEMHKMSVKEWSDLAIEAFDSREYYSDSVVADDVKVDVVQYARERWHMEFSRRYMGFEVELPKAGFTNATLYLNCKGIFIVEPNAKGGQASEGDESFKVLFSHMFEISPASPAPESGEGIEQFTVSYVSGGGLRRAKFTGPAAGRARELAHQFHSGLTLRSKYCIATIDYKAPGAASEFLSFNVGDILILPKKWADVDEGGWAKGKCERTKASGDFPTANVLVLPSLFRPSNDAISKFRTYVQSQQPEANEL